MAQFTYIQHQLGSKKIWEGIKDGDDRWNDSHSDILPNRASMGLQVHTSRKLSPDLDHQSRAMVE